MDLYFNIESNCDCKITVKNLTPINNYLQSKDPFSSTKLRFNESKCVVRLRQIPYEKDKYPVMRSKIMDVREVDFTDLPDGWYKLEAIILPTKKYLDKMPSSWNTNYYYVEDNDIYLYDIDSKKGTKVDNIDNMFTYLENNPLKDFEKLYFAFGFITDYFSLCHLNKCYISKINDVLESLCGNICLKPKANNDDLVYLRDLLMATLDIITYLVQCGRFEEANRILNQIFKCNGLCNNKPNGMSKKGGCGCRPN